MSLAPGSEVRVSVAVDVADRYENGPSAGRLDRYAARNANFVLVTSDRMAVQPRIAGQEILTNSQGLRGDIKGAALGWFVTL
jgi:hypothetical protein